MGLLFYFQFRKNKGNMPNTVRGAQQIILSLLSFSVTNAMTKSNQEEEMVCYIIQLTVYHKKKLGSDLKARTEGETME